MESPPYKGSIARRQLFDGLTALGARLCSLLRPRAHAHSFEIRQHAPAQSLSLMSLTTLESGVAPMALPVVALPAVTGASSLSPSAMIRRRARPRRRAVAWSRLNGHVMTTNWSDILVLRCPAIADGVGQRPPQPI